MKRFLLLGCLVLALSLSSCQCDSPPDIGPVDDAQAVAAEVEVSAEQG